MIIAVGSESTSKIKSVRLAVVAYSVAADVVGVHVPSGVAAQPKAYKKWLRGLSIARARCLAAVPGAELGVGLEGGIMPPILNDPQVLPSSMSCAAVTDGACVSLVTSNGTPLSIMLAKATLAGQTELRPFLQALGLPYDAEGGVNAILTKGVVRRVENDSAAIRTALAPFFNPQAYGPG